MNEGASINRVAIAIFAVPVVAAVAIAAAVNSNALPHARGIPLALVVLTAAYLATAATVVAAARDKGPAERTVWRLFAAGCVFGSVGWLLYAVLMVRTGLRFSDPPPEWLGSCAWACTCAGSPPSGACASPWSPRRRRGASRR